MSTEKLSISKSIYLSSN